MRKPKRKRFTKCSTPGCRKTRPTSGLGGHPFTCSGGRCPVAARKRKK